MLRYDLFHDPLTAAEEIFVKGSKRIKNGVAVFYDLIFHKKNKTITPLKDILETIVASELKDGLKSVSIFDYKYPGLRISEIRTTGFRVYLQLEHTQHPKCPECGRICSRIHSRQTRTVRDYPLFSETELFVKFSARRVRCECGCRKTELFSWVEPRARLTNELISWIQALLRLQMPLADVANFVGVSWDTVKIYDKLQLENFFAEIDLSHARHLAIDEFSLHKGHRYATVVMDIENRQVLWICKGKTRKAIRPFFELLRTKNCINNIESISCDMNAAYARLFREEIPDVKIVYDLFHVMKNFTEVLKEARKRCSSALGKTKELKERNSSSIKDLRKAEWILVKRADDLSIKRKELLDRLVEDNALLAALAPIAQAIREIWACKLPAKASELLTKTRLLLLESAKRFDFAPAKRFAAMLSRRMEGIVYAGQLGFSTNRLEGANNKIKTLRRTSYGFRDIEYFFLRIKAALPGIKRNPWMDMKRGTAILKSGFWRATFT